MKWHVGEEMAAPYASVVGVEDVQSLLKMLERRDVVTTDPVKAEECCGIERDEDGFCIYRPGHPIYVPLPEAVKDD